MTDVALIAASLAGDGDAAERLVRRYHGDCWRFAYRMLGQRHDAEDVVQETFFRMFRALPAYREQDRFRAWLFRILANQCRTALLQRRRRAHWFVGDDLIDRIPDDGVADAVTAPLAPELADALHRAIARLDAKHREAFLLKYGEGMKYKEIAEITGASIPALKMRVKRACEMLRPMLDEARNAT